MNQPGRLDSALAFWGANMLRVREAGMSWPGFGYTPAEVARFGEMGAPIGNRHYILFTWVTASFFIAIAAVAVGLMFWALLAAYPDTSRTPASVFVAVLACVALVSIGWGLPLAMRLAAGFVSTSVDFSGVAPAPGDAALAAKVRFQIRRMTAIMCGIFVPGTLCWIAFDIDAGPILTVLKVAAVVVMAASVWLARKR